MMMARRGATEKQARPEVFQEEEEKEEEEEEEEEEEGYDQLSDKKTKEEDWREVLFSFGDEKVIFALFSLLLLLLAVL